MRSGKHHLVPLLLASGMLLAGCSSSDEPDTSPPQRTSTPGGPTNTRGPTRTPTRVRSGVPTDTRGPTRTPTPNPNDGQDLFVRTTGDDANSGRSPDQALRTVQRAAKVIGRGSTVYVGPGRYTGRVAITDVMGSEAAPVRLIADPSGAHTGDRGGDVILDADGGTIAVLLTRAPFVTIDGFIIAGALPQTEPTTASATSILVRGSSDSAIIQNCVIVNAATADGIRIDTSRDALIFNNLIFANDRGVLISGDARGARVINNTIADGERTGIGLALKGGEAPVNATVINNIIQTTVNNVGIQVAEGPPSARSGYTGNFNLVYMSTAPDQTIIYRPPDVRGDDDVNEDARFVNFDQGDLHLEPDSPAIDAGAGTSAIGSDLVDALRARTTSVDGERDEGVIDLGYHYPR